MIQELTSQQLALARYMSELSEKAYCAEWMDRLEYDLWNAVASGAGRYGAIELTPAHIEKLSQLSHACGGWIAFDEKREEVFVPMDQWLSRGVVAPLSAKRKGNFMKRINASIAAACIAGLVFLCSVQAMYWPIPKPGTVLDWWQVEWMAKLGTLPVVLFWPFGGVGLWGAAFVWCGIVFVAARATMRALQRAH